MVKAKASTRQIGISALSSENRGFEGFGEVSMNAPSKLYGKPN